MIRVLTQDGREEVKDKTEAERLMMQPQAKEHLGAPEKPVNRFSLGSCGGEHSPADAPMSVTRMVGEPFPIALGRPACGDVMAALGHSRTLQISVSSLMWE